MIKRLGIILFALAVSSLMSACTVVSMAKPEDALSVIQIQSYVNNHRAGPVKGKICDVRFHLAGSDSLLYQELADSGDMIIMKTPPGKIKLTSLHCLQYMVLFNQSNTHVFNKPLTFEAKAGYVNYAGKVKINYWAPELGEPMEDRDTDRIQMKVLDEYKDAQTIFLDKYKKLPDGFTFRKSLISK